MTEKDSPTLVTILKTDVISSTLLGSLIQHIDPDMEDVIHSDHGNVTESCDNKTFEIIEKDKEM